MNWTPITERLPEENKVVLVLSNDYGTAMMHFGFYEGKGNWGYLSTGEVFVGEDNTQLSSSLDNTVTHWMPLPEPPKQ